MRSAPADHVARAKRAASEARVSTAERDAAIRAALALGASLRVLAEATGLSHAGVAKIGKRAT